MQQHLQFLLMLFLSSLHPQTVQSLSNIIDNSQTNIPVLNQPSIPLLYKQSKHLNLSYITPYIPIVPQPNRPFKQFLHKRSSKFIDSLFASLQCSPHIKATCLLFPDQ